MFNVSFNRKKNKRPLTAEESNRESSRRLIAELARAEAGLPGVADEEMREIFGHVIAGFKRDLSREPGITAYDTAEMDQVLTKMIGSFGEALKKGDLDTAKRGVNLIHDALTGCRTGFTAKESERIPEVLGERVKRLNQQWTVLVVSDRVFVNRRNAENAEKKYLALEKKYRELYGSLEDYISRHPRQYEFLQTYVPGDDMPENVRELYENMQELDRIREQVDLVKADMNTYRTAWHSQTAQLENLENILSVQNGQLSREERDWMQQAMDDYASTLAKMQQESETLDSMMDEHHEKIMAQLSSVETAKSVVKVSRSFEEIRREFERQAAEEDEERNAQMREDGNWNDEETGTEEWSSPLRDDEAETERGLNMQVN